MGEILEARPAEGERRLASSNVFKITTLGSLEEATDLYPLIGLLAAELNSSVLVTVAFSPSSEYSGSVEKLSGTTTTWYVPGLEASAFFSRSSSEVSSANAGRGSRGEK